MHRFTLFAAIAALVLAMTATADAATKKKAQAAKAGKSKHYVTRPAAAPRYQPWQSNQGWPTSYSDGSFGYGGMGLSGSRY